ncbi:MAG TPA: hypothetical protein VK671_12885 [Mucilaginibacter sp.]|nr:hypothetical protein [Mucilaginibacter sp.]
MNLIKFSVIASLFCALSISAQAQNVKPKFKKFILVSYRPSGSGNKQFVRIENYREIDENGILYRSDNSFNDYYGDLTYDGRTTDTTYRIPDSLIIALNKVFNGSKKLTEHMITNKLPPGANFAGPFEFIAYTANDNTSDNLVIVPSFIDDEIRSLLEKIWRLPHSRIWKAGRVYRNKVIEAQVLKNHKASKYVPEIVEPPRVKELILKSN